MEALLKVGIRDQVEGDFPFIKSSWIKQQKSSSTFNKVPSKIFFNMFSRQLDEIINRSKIYIACDMDYPSQTFGYIAIEGESLNYIYVKSLYRGLGISKRLMEILPSSCVNYTYLSNSAAFRSIAKKANMTYLPYFLKKKD